MKYFAMVLIFVTLTISGAVAQLPNCTPVTVISTDITSNTTFSPSVQYRIQGCITLTSGDTLTILAGTTVTFADNDFLVVEKGAVILATGTAVAPIVFTSAAAPGFRVPLTNAGVVIAGDAALNESPLTLPCSISHTSGSNNADNSGILSYVQFHYLGGSSSLNYMDNGLTLVGVGSGTTIDHVAITHSVANGLGILGGHPSISNLFVMNTAQNDIYISLGAQTNLEEVLTIHKDCSLHAASGTNGLWVENNRSNTTAAPLTMAMVDRSTFIGPLHCGCTPHADFKDGISLNFNAGLELKNSVVTGYNRYGFYVEDQESAENTKTGRVKVNYTSFTGNGTDYEYNHTNIDWLIDGCGDDMAEWMAGVSPCVSVNNQFSSFDLDYNASICGDFCVNVPTFTLGIDTEIEVVEGPSGLKRGSIQPTDQFSAIEACPQQAVYCTPVPLLKAAPESSLQVYPNPAMQTAQITFDALATGNADIVVREMVTGRILYKGKLAISNKGEQSLQVPVSGWKEGVYPVQIRTGQQVLQGKISIQ